MHKPIYGFSKKTKEEKIDWLSQTFFSNPAETKKLLQTYWNTDSTLQQLHDDFIENTITNYYLPLGISPNFLINGELFTIPMVTEESSVVAAASNAAKFWLERGGFKAEVISTEKNGQVHIDFFGSYESIKSYFEAIKPKLLASIESIQANMKKRGGGLTSIKLIDATEKLEGYYQLHCTFETLDAMGANFINSCLEEMAHNFENEAQNFEAFKIEKKFPKVVMSILSNYVPNCTVKAEVSCKISALSYKNIEGKTFADNFVRAIQIANAERKRAVTHNKGIMNGIDAVVIATGNDFRAVEAGIHAYAARNGDYKSLTQAEIKGDLFTFWIEIPLALGTVGGLTSLHPLTKFALHLLQKPNAKQLMKIVAVAGLAQNFAAVKSLVTTGIQQGHMKMHLKNILNSLNASEEEKLKAVKHFREFAVSHNAVESFIKNLR